MEIERAEAIANIAGKIIDSAKVEVDFLKVTGAANGSGFLESDRKPVPAGSAARLAAQK